MSYKVTAPLVIIANADGKSGDWYGYVDAIVPHGLNDERCKQLAKEGMLEKVKAPKEEPETGSDVPTKSASKAKWVEYATSEDRGEQKLSAEDAEALTRDELAEKFTPQADA